MKLIHLLLTLTIVLISGIQAQAAFSFREDTAVNSLHETCEERFYAEYTEIMDYYLRDELSFKTKMIEIEGGVKTSDSELSYYVSNGLTLIRNDYMEVISDTNTTVFVMHEQNLVVILDGNDNSSEITSPVEFTDSLLSLAGSIECLNNNTFKILMNVSLFPDPDNRINSLELTFVPDSYCLTGVSYQYTKEGQPGEKRSELKEIPNVLTNRFPGGTGAYKILKEHPDFFRADPAGYKILDQRKTGNR